MSDDKRCDAELRARIGIAKTNFDSMRKVLTKISLDKLLRMRLLRCYAWSGLLCGCQSWIITSVLQKSFVGRVDLLYKESYEVARDGEKGEQK